VSYKYKCNGPFRITESYDVECKGTNSLLSYNYDQLIQWDIGLCYLIKQQ